MSYDLLNGINSPDDLKRLDKKEIDNLCGEIREFLIQTVSHTGGHLASNLGVVELTVAMHRVFDSPSDQFVFDVGHQCYTHKLITGRRDRFDTLRTEGGLAGFLRPDESEHDAVVSGHSSTSISSALGLAEAKKMRGDNSCTVAVIGDGALTGGLAYEGLNNAGRSKNKLIIVLNDNRMSINKNVGAVARHLAVLRTKKGYFKFKSGVAKVFGAIPFIGKKINKLLLSSRKAIKNTLYNSSMFEDMGFAYMGPVDGHNEPLLERVLDTAKNLGRPVIIHICTLKGKGYTYAEKKPRKFHGISAFDPDSGEPTYSAPTYSSVFGEALCSLAEKDDSVCAVTAAMKSGTGLDAFAEKYRHRFFDVGIAEAHAVTFSAGLAINGMKPFFAVYSSFLQRAYDQLIHDVAIGNENINLVIDRAGIVGDDGETHNGVFDAAMLLPIPNFKVYSPSYFSEISYCVEKCAGINGPCAIRIPRGTEAVKPDGLIQMNEDYAFFDANGKTLAVSYGRLIGAVFAAQEKLKGENTDIAVLKLLLINNICDECLDKAMEYDNIVFFEEGMKRGGVGEYFGSMLLEKGYKGRFIHRAIDDRFVSHAAVSSALAKLQLDTKSIADALREVSK